MLGAPLLAALTLAAVARVRGPRGGLRDHRRRPRDRHVLRLAAHLALGARAEPRRRRALLRDRQRARGRDRGDGADRRRAPGSARAGALAALRGRLVLRRSRGSAPRWRSRRAASAPTSAPRSCFPSGRAVAAQRRPRAERRARCCSRSSWSPVRRRRRARARPTRCLGGDSHLSRTVLGADEPRSSGTSSSDACGCPRAASTTPRVPVPASGDRASALLVAGWR